MGAVLGAIATAFSWVWSPNKQVVKQAPVTFLENAVGQPVAHTTAGDVLGYTHATGVLRFARIPFAAPPIDHLRFLPPQPVAPWQGILDARQPGPICIQRFTATNKKHPAGQSEDCLSLTVTTPKLDQAKRPVIVWLHGGGLANGGNHDATYDGANFVTRGDVVFVNVQYRLGALGWLDVSPLGDEHVKQSKQNGQLDVIAALNWVQRNIAQFGGDPNNVTLMGESAGAYLAASLLLLPEAEPLFHKAILQSGVYDAWEIPADRQELLQRVLTKAKATTLEELQQVSAKTLQTIEQDIYQYGRSKGWPDPMPWYSLQGITSDAFAAAAHQGKPVLHGTLKHEYHLFLLSYGKNNPHGQIVNGFLKILGLNNQQIQQLIEQIQPFSPDRSQQDLRVDLISAIYMHYPHAMFAENYRHAPTYSYLIDWAAPQYPELGAIHALDLPLVFGNFDNWTWALGDTHPEELSHKMQNAWIAFAKTANPNHSDIPSWPTYGQSQRATMVFGETTKVVEDPLSWVRDLGPILDTMLMDAQ
ncbi:carboxylesterase/lipase family protein [Leptothoe kymatousa]|uniref:carboxylesterase/lipase family protein n=1 Tax=Leptothoe kymatousa TaxID=2651727 RepID=UPI001C039299|nr:carboxylesterase family protein [Leptothoe kymatousa]